MISISFSICCFIFLSIIAYMYFSKEKIKNVDNKIFSILIILNLIGILIDVGGFASFRLLGASSFLNIIISKIYLIYFVSYAFCLMLYIYDLNYKESKNKSIFYYIYATICLILFILPIDVHFDGIVGYTYGLAVNFGYGIGFIIILIMFALTIKARKSIGKKNIPLLAFVFLLLLVVIIQKINPQLVLLLFCNSIVTTLMYFTIENPDLKMLREMEMAKLHAEKANRAKSDFLASMSHEIRTPLNAIVGLTEDNMSYKDKVPEVVQENNEDIFNASQTLLEIVGNILDINRIEAEKIDVNPVPYDIREEVDKICKIQSARIGEKPIQFFQTIAEDVPVELIGDKVLVKQILNNLLSNAIKYTEEGTVKIDIHSINRGDDATLMINVSDTGRGIKKEYIDKLFSKFERLDIEKNTTTQGTGLGLAITKSLVEMMGGSINVQSEFGRGTLFVVTLPQKIGKQDIDLSNTQVLRLYNTNKMKAVTPNVEQSVIPDNVEEKGALAEDAMPTLKNVAPTKTLEDNQEESHSSDAKKVLIVDDNNLNLKVARRAVEAIGYEVDEVNSGEDCINKLKEKKYDLILMDIMMPGMSGDETLLKLKEDSGFNIPVIAVTADVESDSERRYLQMGFVSYIGKPFTKDQIKIEIDKIFK